MWRTVAWNLLVSLCQRNFRIWYSLYECEWCLRSDSISHVLKINLLCTMLNHESQLRAITTSLPRWNVQVQLYTVHHIGWPWPTLKTKHCAKYLWYHEYHEWSDFAYLYLVQAATTHEIILSPRKLGASVAISRLSGLTVHLFECTDFSYKPIQTDRHADKGGGAKGGEHQQKQ